MDYLDSKHDMTQDSWHRDLVEYAILRDGGLASDPSNEIAPHVKTLEPERVLRVWGWHLEHHEGGYWVLVTESRAFVFSVAGEYLFFVEMDFLG